MQETWGSIPGLGRSPGGGHGNPLQYSGLENLHGQRSLVGYNPWGCKESDMTERLSIYTVKPGSFSRSMVLPTTPSAPGSSPRQEVGLDTQQPHLCCASHGLLHWLHHIFLCGPVPNSGYLGGCFTLMQPTGNLGEIIYLPPNFLSFFSVKTTCSSIRYRTLPIFLCQNLTLKFLFHSSEGAARCFVLFFK